MSSNKKVARLRRDGEMTSGEKMIWAAAYEAEFHRFLNNTSRKYEPEDAARIAIGHASDAVWAARRAIDNSGLANAAEQALLRSMVYVSRTSKCCLR